MDFAVFVGDFVEGLLATYAFSAVLVDTCNAQHIKRFRGVSH